MQGKQIEIVDGKAWWRTVRAVANRHKKLEIFCNLLFKNQIGKNKIEENHKMKNDCMAFRHPLYG